MKFLYRLPLFLAAMISLAVVGRALAEEPAPKAEAEAKTDAKPAERVYVELHGFQVGEERVAHWDFDVPIDVGQWVTVEGKKDGLAWNVLLHAYEKKPTRTFGAVEIELATYEFGRPSAEVSQDKPDGAKYDIEATQLTSLKYVRKTGRATRGGARESALTDYLEFKYLDTRLSNSIQFSPPVLMFWTHGDADPLPQLLKTLGNRDESFVVAAFLIGWRGAAAKAAVPELILALDDDGTSHRNSAAGPGGQPIQARQDGQQEHGWQVRAMAADALGKIGPDAAQAVPRLVELMGDPQFEMRCHAAIALGKMGAAGKAAIEPLKKIVSESKRSRFKVCAAESLAALQAAADPKVKAEPPKETAPVVTVLKEAPKPTPRKDAVRRVETPEELAARKAQEKEFSARQEKLRELPKLPEKVYVELHSFWVGELSIAQWDMQMPVKVGETVKKHASRDGLDWNVSFTLNELVHWRESPGWYWRASPNWFFNLDPKLEVSEAGPDGKILPTEVIPYSRRQTSRGFSSSDSYSNYLSPTSSYSKYLRFERPKQTNPAIKLEPPACVYCWMHEEENPVPRLVKILEMRDRDFVLVSFLLGWRGAEAKSAVPELLLALNDDGTTHRNWSRQSTGDFSWEVHAAAADALGKIGPDSRDAVPRLVELLADEHPEMQTHAAIALGKIGVASEPAIVALKKLSEESKDARLKFVATESLHALQKTAK